MQGDKEEVFLMVKGGAEEEMPEEYTLVTVLIGLLGDEEGEDKDRQVSNPRDSKEQFD